MSITDIDSHAMASLSPTLRLAVTASWIAPPQFREQQLYVLKGLASSVQDWGTFVSLVDRHRIPALVHANLQLEALGSPVPDGVRVSLEQRDRAARLQAIRHTSKTLDLLKRLAALGVEAIPLKGVFLSQRLYGDVGLRQSKDIDLLVREEHFDAADALLRELGYERPPIVPGYSPTPRQEAYLRETHYHYEYDHPDGTQVELHWRRQSCSNRQMNLLWEHTRQEVFMGVPVRCLDDDLLLLFLCDHGAHHRWFRIKWLSDVAVLFAQRNSAHEEILLSLASQLDLVRPLTQGALLVEWLYGVPMSELMRRKFSGDGTIRALAQDAIKAIAGSEEDGLMRVSIWRKVRFQARLRTRLPWREMVLRAVISPFDFAQLRLPDSLFWVYTLLRPVLWLRRMLSRGQSV